MPAKELSTQLEDLVFECNIAVLGLLAVYFSNAPGTKRLGLAQQGWGGDAKGQHITIHGTRYTCTEQARKIEGKVVIGIHIMAQPKVYSGENKPKPTRMWFPIESLGKVIVQIQGHRD
jgi:hypothetical protein